MATSFIGRADLPQGMRNNNIGNIRPISTGMWEGQIGVSPSNFVIFEDISWGIRAFAMNYYASVTKHGTDTLSKYIYRYAPPSDKNPTANYLAHVSDTTGIAPNAPIPTDEDSVKAILKAQLDIEIGQKYADMITDADIDEGFSKLNSKISSFFSAAAIAMKAYPVNTALIGSILIGITGYVYYLKKKKII